MFEPHERGVKGEVMSRGTGWFVGSFGLRQALIHYVTNPE